jgi:mono/diheme cytochrome c family protein
MRATLPLVFTGILATLSCAGCNHRPGPPQDAQALLRPEEELHFDRLYSQNCSACHGREGRDGPALDLANPVYESLIDDASLRKWITQGMRNTQMPAFGEKSGGFLTEKQVDALVTGMRSNWLKGTSQQTGLAPPYTSALEGNVDRGSQLFQGACASCHQKTNQNVTDTSYLALVSNQALRTIIIAGRPDLGHPDWQHVAPQRPLTDQDVTDVVAYLGSLRSETPGQPYPSIPTAKSSEK